MATVGNNTSAKYEHLRESFFTEGERKQFEKIMKHPNYDFKIAELCNMCIDSNYRKQGIGNALYKEFERALGSKA